MKWALVDQNNICVNVIEYRENSGFRAPDNLTIVSVNDWVNIGDSINKENPVLIPEPLNEQKKKHLHTAAYRASIDDKLEIIIEERKYTCSDEDINLIASFIRAEDYRVALGLPYTSLFPIKIESGKNIISLNDAKSLCFLFSSEKARRWNCYMSLAERIEASDDFTDFDIDAEWAKEMGKLIKN